MLKVKYRNLSRPEDVDTDPETKCLHKVKKDMLKEFMRHINYVSRDPSTEDKLCLLRAYYEEYKKSPEYRKSLEAKKEVPKAPEIDLPPSVKSFSTIKHIDDNGKEQYYRLTEHVSAKWKKFGQQIGIIENDLIDIYQQGYTNEERFNKVMQKWLDGQGINIFPYTWEGVWMLLEGARFKAEIPKMKEALRNAVHPQ